MRARSIRAVSAGAAMVLALAVGISLVSTSAEAAARHHAKPRPIAAFIGDSFTQGAGATTASHRFVNLVAAKERWRPVNLGRGGTGYVTSSNEGTISCGLAYCGAYGERVDDAMAAKAKVVIVSGGINDIDEPIAEFRSGVDQLFGALTTHMPKGTFIAVTTPQWPDADPPTEFIAMVAAVKASATAHHVHYLNIGEPLATGTGVKAMDGVHPNNAGHLRLANAIERRLTKVAHP